MNAIVFIPLTQGKVAVIDFDDFEKVRPHNWFAWTPNKKTFYAARNIKKFGKRRREHLHRLIFGEENIPKGFEVAHKDGDGLNCRQENLRSATHAQNLQGVQRARGASGFRGVGWYRAGNKWQAQLQHNKKKFYLGYFKSEEDAARAYDKKARELFGEFAAPNFPNI